MINAMYDRNNSDDEKNSIVLKLQVDMEETMKFQYDNQGIYVMSNINNIQKL